MSEHRCEGEVKRGTGWHSYKTACGKSAKFQHDEKWYCGTHNPVKRNAQADLTQRRWKAESDLAKANKGHASALNLLAMAVLAKSPAELADEIATYQVHREAVIAAETRLAELQAAKPQAQQAESEGA